MNLKGEIKTENRKMNTHLLSINISLNEDLLQKLSTRKKKKDQEAKLRNKRLRKRRKQLEMLD